MIGKSPRIPFGIVSIFVLFSTILAACRAAPASNASTEGLAMASMSGMPAEVKSAPVTVKQAYQFAVANPEVLKQIPCYCGCGREGHTSNYACYVKNVAENGVITYDDHALGCSICVDITQDTMRLSKQGKAVIDIKAIIDQTYAQYGPSNIP